MVLTNTLVGQNGFLTAALIGATLYLIPVRPVLAGICLGLLSYKPQYGLLFPIVLIAAAQWRVFASAAVTTIVLAAASWLAFGTDSWRAFVEWMPMFSQAFLVEGKAPGQAAKHLCAVRYFGGARAVRLGRAWLFTASVATVLALLWRSRVPYSLKAAALATGILLVTPYLFLYDLMVLAISVGFLIRIGLQSGSAATNCRRWRSRWRCSSASSSSASRSGLGISLVVPASCCAGPARWWREPRRRWPRPARNLPGKPADCPVNGHARITNPACQPA